MHFLKGDATMQGITILTDNTRGKINFSEKEIIEIQDYFLTPGIHTIKFKDVSLGRLFLDSFLPLLSSYTKGAYLSLVDLSPSCGLVSLYRELIGACEHGDTNVLEDYMLTSFYYDYLIIEETEELKRAGWYQRFRALLEKYNYVSTAPIVIFNYE